MFDIHSHILPAIDDGAKDLNESLELLKLMHKQGVTDCMATPHFYPHTDNLDDFLAKTHSAFMSLKAVIKDKKLPNIYLGSEMLYYEGIGNSFSIKELCLNGSKLLLLELTDFCINDNLFKDLNALQKKHSIIPIIAHIERYHKAKNYRKLLKFIAYNKIPAQINASSVLIPKYSKVIKKLISSDITLTLASDAHSYHERPPQISAALETLDAVYGENLRTKLFCNSAQLYKKIVSESDINA